LLLTKYNTKTIIYIVSKINEGGKRDGNQNKGKGKAKGVRVQTLYLGMVQHDESPSSLPKVS